MEGEKTAASEEKRRREEVTVPGQEESQTAPPGDPEESPFRYTYMHPESYRETIERKPFLELLPDIFSYPFKGNGRYLLIGGTAAYLFIDLLSYFMIFSLLGLILAIIFSGYLAAFIMKIISSSSDGAVEPPDWPDFTDLWDDILCPAAKVGGTTIFCFIPFIIYLFSYYPLEWFMNPRWLYDPVTWLLLLSGILYYPMALIAMSPSDSVSFVNPVFVLPSIIKVFRDYIAACLVLLLVIMVRFFSMFFFPDIPLVSSVVTNFLSLYFILVEMRILGLLYFANQERLGWFGEG